MKIASLLLLSLISTSIAQANAYDPNESAIGIDLNAIDQSVKPCDDFYQYACGNWLKNTDIPNDKAMIARSFIEISDRNLETLHKSLEQLLHSEKKLDSETQKLTDFYRSCTNEKEIEKDSSGALKAEFAILDSLKSKEDYAVVIAKLRLIGVPTFFAFDSETDLKDPDHTIAGIGQGGYNLPDPTYFTSNTPQNEKIRKAYVEYVQQMLTLTGTSAKKAKADAIKVYQLQETLAKASVPPELAQDPTAMYHPVTEAELKTSTPSLNWDAFFKTLGISVPSKINNSEPKFLTAVEGILKNTDLQTIKIYMRFRIVHAFASSSGKKLLDPWFQFNGATLGGRKVLEPRWKRCLDRIGQNQGGMGEALGKVFVEKTFSPTAKARANEMIKNIRAALKDELEHLDWLDSATRTKALEKLEKITQKIGYPDKWRDYSDLKITKDHYLANVVAANTFAERFELNKIGRAVDPSLWQMMPPDVDAYYAPDMNQINFPAGILQAPFFDEKFSDAANYGAIGMVIGHEITHGFDTSGSKFDGRGMASDWWSPKVKQQFEAKATCMKKQYSAYQVFPDLKVNGDLTITENIADNGGLKLAYAAYQKTGKNQQVAANVGAFTPDQQFFLSNAQSWCWKVTDESLRQLVSGNPHSPAQFRVNGSYSNSPDFAKAFSCSDGSKMAPKDRCIVW